MNTPPIQFPLPTRSRVRVHFAIQASMRSTTCTDLARIALAVITLCVSLLTVPAALARSSGDIHIPTTLNYCGADEVIVEATICNNTDSGQFYFLTFENSGAYEGCDLAIIPQYEFLDPNPVFVPRGACDIVSIRVQRPSELNSLQSVCYWLHFHPDEQGPEVWLGGTLIDRPVVCVDWYFEESAHFLHPLVPIELGPIVENLGFEPLQMFYIFEARNEFDERDFETISLDGQAPGEWSFGNLEVTEGGSQELQLQVEWLNEGASGYYDIVMMDESSFEVLASIGLHLIVEPPSDVTDDPLDSATPPALWRNDITVLPNPSGGSGLGVRFQLNASVTEHGAIGNGAPAGGEGGANGASATEPGTTVSASVFGPDGRKVRSLFHGNAQDRAAAAGMLEFDWDGRDDQGRLVGSGIYWIDVTTVGRRWSQKFTRVE